MPTSVPADQSPPFTPASTLPPTISHTAPVPKAELAMAIACGVLLLALRWLYRRNLVWSSDEPQHLHVVWAWVNGLLPYRDVFDNHSPLFSLLCSPLLALLGERRDPISPMRLAMIPIWGMSVWFIFRIGASCFSRRVGIWAAVLVNLLPNYYFLMGEFRTDVLWTTLWLGALTILVGGPLTTRRLFFAGLTLGATFGVSMKTVLLLITLLSAGAIVWLVRGRFFTSPHSPGGQWKRGLAGAAAALAGLAVIPAALVALFAYRGALDAMWYCVIQHNALPGGNTLAQVGGRIWTHGALWFVPFVAWCALAKPPVGLDAHVALRRVFLRLGVLVFIALLRGLWPVVSPQDYGPWFPLVAIAVTPAILSGVDFLDARWKWAHARTAFFVLIVLFGFGWLTRRHHPFAKTNRANWDRIAQVLDLTRPDEYVMDGKGELVFRKRAFYYALETLTLRRIALGLIPDDINERLIATHTAVLSKSGRLTVRARTFVRENYLQLGRVQVLGKQAVAPVSGRIAFDIVIPETYALLDAKGVVPGTLDGTPIDGPRALAAGHHEIVVGPDAGKIAVVWARAVEKGYSPFTGASD